MRRSIRNKALRQPIGAKSSMESRYVFYETRPKVLSPCRGSLQATGEILWANQNVLGNPSAFFVCSDGTLLDAKIA